MCDVFINIRVKMVTHFRQLVKGTLTFQLGSLWLPQCQICMNHPILHVHLLMHCEVFHFVSLEQHAGPQLP